VALSKHLPDQVIISETLATRMLHLLSLDHLIIRPFNLPFMDERRTTQDPVLSFDILGEGYIAMRHSREAVIERVCREYELLDNLVGSLPQADWARLVPRPEGKDAWTIKDALAHITHWKADVTRKIRRQPVPPEERGLDMNDGNHLIYIRWRDRSPQEVLSWHRQVQADLLAALRDAPESWFTGREHRPEWPFDIDGHSAFHRIKDIQRALSGSSGSLPIRG
jgi:hypothetical protein